MKKTILLILVIGGFVNLACQTKTSKESASSNESTGKQELANTLIPFKKGNKWGYSDVNKKIIVLPKYDEAQPFVDGRAQVRSGWSVGFLDESGNEIVPLKYYLSESFREGLAQVSMKDGKNAKYGFIDKSGKEVIPLIYEYASPFQEGLAQFKKGDKWGFIDKTGKEVIPPIYDKAEKFSEDLALVAQDKVWRFIDKTGKEVLAPTGYYSGSFTDGLAKVSKGERGYINGTYNLGKNGFIDKTGNEVIPAIYDYAYPFSEGLARVEKDKKAGFIDKTGKIVIPFNFGLGVICSEGVVVVTDFTGTTFFLDKNGQELFQSQYSFPENKFSDGLIKFYISSKNEVGFMDKTGKVVIKPKYYDASPFKNGLAKVSIKGSSSFYIDKDGTEYYEP